MYFQRKNMTIERLMVLVCTIASFNPTSAKCYNYKIVFPNGDDVLTKNIYPITNFPEGHAYVKAADKGNPICGMDIKAGDLIPGTKEATKSVSDGKWSSYNSKNDVPMWSTTGRTNRGSCGSNTACLDESNDYEFCNTNGFISSGVAWYAYNYPEKYSANTGHEQSDTALLYFVASEDDETSLVIAHDKPYDNTYGKVKWQIEVSHESKAEEEVFLILRDDNINMHRDCTDCCDHVNKDQKFDDCYSWKWDKSKKSGKGTFAQRWGVCCTDGMVMGPMPSDRFTMSIQYLWRMGIEHFKIGSLENDSNGKPQMTFTDVDIGRMKEGIRVEGYTCDAFCSSYKSCGQCTDNKDCGWCSDGKGGGKCLYALDGNKKQTCEADSGSKWTPPLTCCNTNCGQHKQCGQCLSDSDCGWCQSTNECISGNQNGICPSSGKKCPKLERVAPYESPDAFVHDKCPCTLDALPPGFEAAGDCEDLDKTFCAQHKSLSESKRIGGQTFTPVEACCKYGGGNLKHQKGCIKWTRDNLKEKCSTNMHIFPNIDSAENCLHACATSQGCLRWTFSEDSLECVGCLSQSDAASIKEVDVRATYRTGTNTCNKGCYAGSRFGSGKKCLVKCEQGFQSSSGGTGEYTCDAGDLSLSPGSFKCAAKSCNGNDLDLTIGNLDKKYFTKGACEGETVASGGSCDLGCSAGFQKPSIEVSASCDKGTWNYNELTQSVCVKLRCDIGVDQIDELGRVGVDHQGLAACSASSGLDGDQECYVTCKRGFSSKDSAYGKFKCEEGKLKEEPDLKCSEIVCPTNQLKTGGNFNSQRADEIKTSPLEFEQKVSFKCKKGYAIEDGTDLIDEQLCDSKWNPAYVPKHNDQCKPIRCPTTDIELLPGQVIVDKNDKEINGKPVVAHSEAVKVKCKSPSYHGAESERIECKTFSSFKRIPSIKCEPVRCDIAALKLASQTQTILSSTKSGYVDYKSWVKVGCATGFYNPKTSMTVTCNTITSFSEFDNRDLTCQPITCNIGDMKLSPGAVVKEVRRFGAKSASLSGSVQFRESVIIGCGEHDKSNEISNYFSQISKDYRIELKCETPNSFKDETGTGLKCKRCTDVDGCEVPETCTTATDSKCARCSNLGHSNHAYREIGTGNNKATQCKKCGRAPCPLKKEEKLIQGSKECDGKGKTNPYTCTNCNLIQSCEEQDPTDCDTCIRCKDVFYNDKSKPNKCLICLKNSASDSAGTKFIPNCRDGECTSVSNARCVVCDKGFYVNSDGSCTECSKCQKGERLVKACTGSANEDDKRCQKCPQGTYSDTPNAATCTRCPDTSTTETSDYADGRASCFCAAGFSVANEKCIPCNVNEYMSKKSTVVTNKKCNKCPTHSSTNKETRVDNVAQCQCEAGYFFSQAQGDAIHVCTPCERNHYKDKLGNDKQCQACRPGSETLDTAPFTSATECHCIKGFGAPNARQSCEKCAVNYFKDSVASTTCTACPDKSTTDDVASTASADCKCDKGYARVGDTCKICPAGKYADQRGQLKCKDCPSASTTRAFDNNDKKWTTITGAESVSQCVCKGGYRKVQNSPVHSCVVCTEGTFAQEDAARCEDCPQHSTTLSQAAVKRTDCLCIKGYFGRITNRKGTCKPCAAGFFKNTVGTRRCDICERNTGTTVTGTTAKGKCECDPGYKLASASSGGEKCRTCPANFYKKSPGDASTCTACPAHSSTRGGVTGATRVAECVCDPGYYAAEGEGGVQRCVECGVDTYKDRYGNEKCQACRKDSTSQGKNKLTSADGCVCETGFFLYQSSVCKSCSGCIPNCEECKPRTDMSVSKNPAVCTRVGFGYKIDDTGLVEPKVCGSVFEFEFGNDAIHSAVDLSHCLENALVPPATGILCQPRCQSKYQTRIDLPEWKDFSKNYCNPGTKSVINVEWKQNTNPRECQQYCEAYPDCFYFAMHNKDTECDLWRGNGKCKPVDGANSRFHDNSVWWSYEGLTDLGFAFVCNDDGKWRVNGISDKDKATAFFEGQCEVAPTIPTTTTTTVPEAKVRDDREDPDLVLPVVLAFGAAGIIVVLVVIIVFVTRKKNTDKEEGERRPRKSTLAATETEVEEVMNKAPEEEDEKSGTLDVALDVVDDVPT